MDEATGFQDWELLQTSDAAPSIPADKIKVPESIDADSEDGAIKHDYFSLDAQKRQLVRDEETQEEEGGGTDDSDNPSWIDPDSDSRYVNRPRGQMGFARSNSGGFWSDESSDGRRSVAGSEKGELGDSGDVDFNGIEPGHLNFGGIGAVVEGNEGFLDKLGPSEVVDMGDRVDDESAAVSTARDGPNNLPRDEGNKRGVAWWKMPFEILKFCAFRGRPIWSISMAVAFVGIVMLGRRLYKMKPRSRNIPLKIALDDKKVSQFMVRAARLNEAFSVVRRVPIGRPALPFQLAVV